MRNSMNSNRKTGGLKKNLQAASLVCLLCLLSVFPAKVRGADLDVSSSPGSSGIPGTAYTNPSTGYSVIIEDHADLLSEEEEDSLISVMEAVTEYGNAAFVTLETNPFSSTQRYAENYTDSYFSSSTGTVLVIDMDYRVIYLDTTGSMRTYLTGAYADTITDNVYSYASRGDYYGCASAAFEQAATLLKGGRIAQPMKYISNVLLALVLALLVNYLIVMCMSRKHKPSRAQLLSGIFHSFTIRNGNARLVNQTRVYSPPSSSGGGHSSGGRRSGGGGRSGGGSRSGGGGRSGGHSGGGHRF